MVRINILELLAQKGKSRSWLGKQLGMGGQNLNKILYGKTKGIHFETIEALCQVLECTPNDLFCIDDE
ncbi:helix-turn-helix domain-containing protein [Anaerotruncus rubiinfantis]|uniref:helix-turn-helix domain-containing protein n=1 Tax=Anaerotruncus rubiinfantis TaxID=1720200 RepID=UPI00082BBE7D|nr:helix-turn-helix domain-containing protein [Anaerotruncus rubiinfantis]